MKIAMPLAKGRVAELSEDCDRFTIVHVDLAENRILDSRREEPGPEWRGRLAPWLAEQAVDLVIAVDVGPQMKANLIDNNIRVIAGTPNNPAHSVVKSYLAGDLNKTEP